MSSDHVSAKRLGRLLEWLRDKRDVQCNLDAKRAYEVAVDAVQLMILGVDVPKPGDEWDAFEGDDE